MAITIAKWLNGSRDYNTGIELLEKIGGDPFMLSILKKGNNSYSRSKLEKELRSFLPAEKPSENSSTHSPGPSDQSTDPIPTRSPMDNVPESDASDQSLPKEILSKKIERQRMYRENDYMKNSLSHADKKTKTAYCLAIVENAMAIQKIWKEIDHFEATGTVIDLHERLIKAPKDIHLQIANARSNLSKAKRRGKPELEKKWKEKLNELLALGNGTI